MCDREAGVGSQNKRNHKSIVVSSNGSYYKLIEVSCEYFSSVHRGSGLVSNLEEHHLSNYHYCSLSGAEDPGSCLWLEGDCCQTPVVGLVVCFTVLLL